MGMRLAVRSLFVVILSIRAGDLSADLIHRWSFEGDDPARLVDTVGGADASIVHLEGGGGSSLAEGRVRLDGGHPDTADYVSLPGGLLSDQQIRRGGEISIEIWATPESFTRWGRLFTLGPGSSDLASLYLTLSHGDDGDRQRLHFEPLPVLDSRTESDTRRSHYVITWRRGAAGEPGGEPASSRLEWYRDGELMAGADTGGWSIDDVDDTVFWLGRPVSRGEEVANVSFDEVRIWSHVLSAAEIAENTEIGPDGAPAGEPLAVDDRALMQPGDSLRLDVVANDEGVGLSNGQIEVVEAPGRGDLIVAPGGELVYRHDGGPAGTDSFRYRAVDAFGRRSEPAGVELDISAAPRIGAPTLNFPDTAPDTEYSTEIAWPGIELVDPLALATPPDESERLFVVERRLGVSVLADIAGASPRRLVFLDIRDRIRLDSPEEGALGLAFHPSFADNGRFFVFYTVSVDGERYQRLSRFLVSADDPMRADPTSETVLFTFRDEYIGHNGGDLHFGPDGYLYVALGDEGIPLDPDDNSQRIDKDFFSGVLRLDVDRRPDNLEPNAHSAIELDDRGLAHYAIPADNPWVGADEFNGLPVDPSRVRSEFWAVGLRHPWRMSFDPITGELWTGDVGFRTQEEVDVLVAGGNYGWVYLEGTHVRPQTPPPGSTFTAESSVAPIWTYERLGIADDATYAGNSVTGGVVYRGSRFEELYGKYIFADYVSGNIWSLERGDDAVDVARLAGDTHIVAFGVDPTSGEVLLVDYGESTIKRLTQRIPRRDFPERLSDTGIYSDLASLTPNPGIHAYDPIVTFWSDHARKERWFSVPDAAATLRFANDAPWDFPTGTTWIKHFDLELVRGDPQSAVRVETRILRRTDEGAWGVSYRWNEAGTEARLVNDGGEDIFFDVQEGEVSRQQHWRIPSRAECDVCHTPRRGFALSFGTRQLHRNGELGGQTGDTIELLRDYGYFDGEVPPVAQLPRHVSPDDGSADLEQRVRSYLDVNCASCHEPGGGAPPSWDARAEISLEATGLVDNEAFDQGGNPQRRLVAPGSPELSVLIDRVRGSNGFRRMPPLGSNELDHGAIELLTEWTLSLATQPEARFRRGDADASGRLDLTDAVSVLQHLFLGGSIPCADAADSDDSGRLNLSDAVVVLEHLFRGGPPPADPFEACGEDETEDELDCSGFPACS